MFTNTNSGLTPTDVLALGNCNSGWGDGSGSWIWLIIVFALIFGWGNNGFGGFGGGSGAMNNYVLNSDFSELSRQLDSATDRLSTQSNSIANGLCDGFYTQAQLVNGVNQNIATTGYGIQNAITQDTIANMQNANAIQSQLASCCCENREAIANVNYNLATQNCATNTLINSATRDIVDSQNANTRAILDAIQQNKVEAMKDRIAEQSQQIQALNLAQSQAIQNNTLISALRPTPIPAYITANPYCNCGNAYAYGNYFGTTVS